MRVTNLGVAAAQAGCDGDGGGLLVAPLGGAARRRNGQGQVRRDGRHQQELCKESSSNGSFTYYICDRRKKQISSKRMSPGNFADFIQGDT